MFATYRRRRNPAPPSHGLQVLASSRSCRSLRLLHCRCSTHCCPTPHCDLPENLEPCARSACSLIVFADPTCTLFQNGSFGHSGYTSYQKQGRLLSQTRANRRRTCTASSSGSS
uniref:(northern house mosquito) hypothetical protein n=1 Tax=Culex pipiens TaxID=7175 RepID=A0A8D8PK51_CULPI